MLVLHLESDVLSLKGLSSNPDHLDRSVKDDNNHAIVLLVGVQLVVQGGVDGKHELVHGVCHSLSPQGFVEY